MRGSVTILFSFLTLLTGVIHAEERPWGVIAPFGSGTANPDGYQGRYNPWDNQGEADVGEPIAPTQRRNRQRIRQGWQNIYQPREAEVEIWPAGQESASKGDDGTQGRMFGNKSLSDDEQWPERPSREPYNPAGRFQTPFGSFNPNMMPQPPNIPYGGFNPYRPRY